ncbi:MAG TPA: glycoside hydrolase family 76 protein [Streptosporangiaceae bacterium]|nr:glycoside hydrolase family 76 protein [Streptosporangiaceae bacterium]
MGEPGERDYRAYAAAGVAALQRWYRPWTGRWRTTGWWNAANALTAVIDYTQRTGDQTYARVCHRTFLAARCRHRHFLVRFFDDNGWWALAWIKAYDLTSEDRYLDAARRIFDNLVTGWDDTCGGGVWWNEDRKYKNAITNELFLTVAVKLHQRSGARTSEYLDWALREWDWLSATGMIGAGGLVNDGLTADCKNNGRPTYTYNQGVVLGGLASLYEVTGDDAYLRQGESIAGAALVDLTSPPTADPPGILIEPGEADMVGRAGDGSQFKGIFARYLYDLYLHSRRPAYRDFLLRNADSIWDNSRNPRNQFGLRWTGPFDIADASRQSSALEALNAALALAS